MRFTEHDLIAIRQTAISLKDVEFCTDGPLLVYAYESDDHRDAGEPTVGFYVDTDGVEIEFY